MVRDFNDPKPSWKKQIQNTHFKDPVPCPYCGTPFGSSLMLVRHCLQPHPKGHNWNQEYKDQEEQKQQIIKDMIALGWIYPEDQSDSVKKAIQEHQHKLGVL